VNAQQGEDSGQLKFGASITDRIHIGLTQIMDMAALNELVFIPYPNKNQIWIYFKQNDIDNLSAAWVFDFQYYTSKGLMPIYKRVMNPCSCACGYQNNVYTGTSGGQIYLEDTGNTIGGDYGSPNGSWYDFTVTFPRLELGQAGIYKVIKKIKLLCNSAVNNNFTVTLNYQGVAGYSQDYSVKIPSNIFQLGINSLGDGSLLGYDTDLPFELPSKAKFQSLQITLKGTSVQNDMSLRMFSLINIQDLQAS